MKTGQVSIPPFVGCGILISNLRLVLALLFFSCSSSTVLGEVVRKELLEFQFGELDGQHLPVRKSKSGALVFEPSSFLVARDGRLVIYEQHSGKALILDVPTRNSEVISANELSPSDRNASRVLVDEADDQIYFVSGDASKILGVDMKSRVRRVAKAGEPRLFQSAGGATWKVKSGVLRAGKASFNTKNGKFVSGAGDRIAGLPPRLTFREAKTKGDFLPTIIKPDGGECKPLIGANKDQYIEEGDVLMARNAMKGFVRIFNARHAFSEERKKMNLFAALDFDNCKYEVFCVDAWDRTLPSPRFAVTNDGRLLQLICGTNSVKLLEWKVQ